MNKTLFNVFVFTAGAAVGSLVTWKVVKTKYERIAQEEIDSVKEAWARRMRKEVAEDDDWNECDEDEEDDVEYDFDDSETIAYHELARKYSKSGDDTENDGEGERDVDNSYISSPYVITPTDFGDGNYDHELRCLSYYSDGVLADDWNEIQDIDDTIGVEALNYFGDHAEDVVHVRNERLQADYEVVRDPRKYIDVVAHESLTGAYAD